MKKSSLKSRSRDKEEEEEDFKKEQKKQPIQWPMTKCQKTPKQKKKEILLCKLLQRQKINFDFSKKKGCKISILVVVVQLYCIYLRYPQCVSHTTRDV